MITIIDKTYCCGCGACVQVCHKQCISMSSDNEGFLYPKVDSSICIDCGLCEKVCPAINQNEPREPLAVYAAKNTNKEIRLKSSSGGIFTLLAEQIIAEGGVVFGAKFNENWEVIHDYTETLNGLSAFRGSKYVQSIIGNSYNQAEQFLKDGRKVLFSGTPCQILGLKRYLHKKYDKLLLVDFVCHGVPSPKVWRTYLREKCIEFALQGNDGKNTVLSTKDIPAITGINFRDKSRGWKKYSVTLNLTKAYAEGEKNSVSHSCVFYENAYMRTFLADLTLRPSCYDCPAKGGRSGSDITIGDFWGVEHIMSNIDDDKGVSLVMIHNSKYEYLCKSSAISIVKYDDVKRYNPSVECSVAKPLYRELFFKIFLRTSSFYTAFDGCVSMNITKRVRRVIWSKLGV